MLKTVEVTQGDWRTLEYFWNASGVARFREPAGAEIKVRYGDGRWLGVDRQRQTLDGIQTKELRVSGFATYSYARMQMRVTRTTVVTYDVEPA